MSRENVEIVRRAYEVWNAGDMDAFRELVAPDVIARTPEGWPEPGPFVGREAFTRWCEQLRETWDADAPEPIGDFIDIGDRVAVRQIWHGAGSGPEANLEMTWVGTVRKGKIVFVEFFWDHAEALEAVGLSEQAMSQENVEVVRAAWEAWTDGDMDRLFTLYADDVFWDLTNFREWPDAVYEGHAGVRRFLSEWRELWDAYEIGVDEIVLAPDARVVVLGWQRGVGRGSGLTMDIKWAQINTVRDGKIVRMDNYDDRRKALETVGLSEQDAHADS